MVPSNNERSTRLAEFLRQHRGAALRAWRHDFDHHGAGWVSHADFAKACRSIGLGAEASLLWGELRPDGSSGPLRFRELDAHEADNLEDFAEVLWQKAGCGDLDKAWAALDRGKRSYVTQQEFVQGGRSLGMDCDLSLVFKGLDLRGQGHLSRQDFEYVRTMSRVFQQMGRSAPSITALSAWVQAEFGGASAFLDRLGLGKAALAEGDLGLVPSDLAARLKALGFQSDALSAAVAIARSAGGTGTHVSGELLTKVLAGQRVIRSASSGALGRRPLVQARSGGGVNSSAASCKKSVSAGGGEDPPSFQQRLSNGWNDSLGAAGRVNLGKPASLRAYFSTPARDMPSAKPAPSAYLQRRASAKAPRDEARQRERRLTATAAGPAGGEALAPVVPMELPLARSELVEMKVSTAANARIMPGELESS
jgi:hypothetical protein